MRELGEDATMILNVILLLIAIAAVSVVAAYLIGDRR